MNFNIKNNNGNITVNKKVIGEIAAIKTSECSNVAGLSAKSGKRGIVGLLKPESAVKGVDVKIDSDNSIYVMLHIVINYGANIFAVSNDVIESVKNELVKALGNENISVDVNVEGVVRNELGEKSAPSVEISQNDSIAEVLGIKAGLIGFVKKENNVFNALIDDEVLVSGEDINGTAENLIDYMTKKAENAGIIALYYIEGLDDYAYELSDLLSEKYSDFDVEVHCVEGSDYDYIIGVE